MDKDGRPQFLPEEKSARDYERTGTRTDEVFPVEDFKQKFATATDSQKQAIESIEKSVLAIIEAQKQGIVEPDLTPEDTQRFDSVLRSQMKPGDRHQVSDVTAGLINLMKDSENDSIMASKVQRTFGAYYHHMKKALENPEYAMNYLNDQKKPEKKQRSDQG